MCQIHAGAYVSLLAPGRTDYTDCHPRRTTTYILHVWYLSLRIRTSDASQLESRNKGQKIRESKRKERKENTRKPKRKEKKRKEKKRKEKKRKEKQERRRQEEEESKCKIKKKTY